MCTNLKKVTNLLGCWRLFQLQPWRNVNLLFSAIFLIKQLVQGQPAAPPDEIVRVSKELSKLEDFMECISSLRTKRKVCITFTFLFRSMFFSIGSELTKFMSPVLHSYVLLGINEVSQKFGHIPKCKMHATTALFMQRISWCWLKDKKDGSQYDEMYVWPRDGHRN